MINKWSIGKQIRYRMFCFTNFFIYGFGFAYPEERKEFYEKYDDDILD